MSAKTNNLKIGIFTLIGVGLVVASLLVFGAWTNLQKGSLFETYVTGDVSGLSLGSAVELRGVRVGKVTAIGFSWNEYQDTLPGSVVVVFEMNDSVTTLPEGKERGDQFQAAVDRGLRARLQAQGVTGTCIVSLEYMDPAENPPLKVPWTPRHTYIPSARGLLEDLLSSLLRTLHKVDKMDLAELGQLGETDLKSAGRLLGRAERLDLEGMGSNAAALLAEVRTSNTKLQSFLAETQDTMKKMKLEQLTHDVDGLIGQLQETVARLQPGLANIDFDAINQSLATVRRTLHDMDDLLLQLKQYPAGFIFGQPPPPVKEVQPPSAK